MSLSEVSIVIGSKATYCSELWQL